MAEQQKTKKKCRQYSLEYLKYGFISAPTNNQLPLCLMCEKTFSNEAMKPSRLLEHLQRVHPDKKNHDLSFFEKLRESFERKPTLGNMFYSLSQKNSDGVRASYNIALLIAKNGQSHTVGEKLILPAISEVIKTVLHKPPHDILKTIPLSNDTVQRRIDEMASSVQNKLCCILRETEFALEIDESTLPDNDSLLLSYVRFIHNEKLEQELLFACLLETDTKGESIFHVVENFFLNENIPLTNIVACATDGAPSMVGRHKGFLAYLKNVVPNVLTVHCVIHRQHLVAKNLSDKLNNSLQIVITAVNKIKKNSLNDRLFRKLCHENDEDFERLLLHTEVRWLSKGNCLQRFYQLFHTVLQFFDERNNTLSNDLREAECDIAYLADLFSKFNDLNLRLQGQDVTLIKAKSEISAFNAKLILYKRNIGRHELSQFPNLLELQEKEKLSDSNILIFCNHLQLLHEDMQKRFEDLVNLNVPDWIINPYINIESISDHLMEETIIELQNDVEMKPKFKNSFEDFWLQKKISERYPTLWAVVKKFLLCFPTSYLVEKGFSAVSRLLTKQRNKLNIVDRGDLRLLLSNIKPDINTLLNSHQIHPSH